MGLGFVGEKGDKGLKGDRGPPGPVLTPIPFGEGEEEVVGPMGNPGPRGEKVNSTFLFIK